MNNLQIIIVIAASLSIPVSIWAIVYYVGRMVMHYKITRDLGDMPTREEVSAMYDQNNAVIMYSPTARNKTKV